jgi:transcriptional regulator with XRE-family HTH domain
MKYPDFIKQLRQQSGMTQIELADALSVSASSIKRWENSRVKLSYPR